MTPDDFWERVKVRYPQLAGADVTDDQTHDHHLFICFWLFGGAGFVGAISSDPIRGWALGALLGVVAYGYREIKARMQLGWSYKPWDGRMDVLKPAAYLSPALVILDRGAAWWQFGMMIVLMLAYTEQFFLGRPR